uniref:Uncharacterized protein n=1 Tax=Arundo donax TaxID=35708 RepID=A0A0A9H779_ARUDO
MTTTCGTISLKDEAAFCDRQGGSGNGCAIGSVLALADFVRLAGLDQARSTKDVGLHFLEAFL